MRCKFLNCQSGATGIEYGILAAGIALAIVAAVYAFGGDLSVIFNSLGDTTNNS